MAAGAGAGRQHLRTQAQLAGHPGPFVLELATARLAFALLFQQIPLVQHQRGRAARLHRQLGDPQVLGGHPVAGVAHDQRHVGAFGGPPRAQRRVVLDRVADLGGAADPGRVHERQLLLAEPQDRVDRIAGGAGAVGDDHPLPAQEAVDQRRLADVRAPDHGQAHLLLVVLRLRLLGSNAVQELDDPVQQVPGSQALGGGHRNRVTEAETVELGRQREVRGAVALVGRDDARHRLASQQIGELLVARAAARRERPRPAPRPPIRPLRRAPARGSSSPADPRRGRRSRPCRRA